MNEGDSFGDRLADRVAQGMGSWRFVISQTIFIVAWMIGNVVTLQGIRLPHWDPYPFILLNLVFSTQAAYASPIILMSSNRQEARDRKKTEQYQKDQMLTDEHLVNMGEMQMEHIKAQKQQNDKTDARLARIEKALGISEE